ncbi:hypothetical protein [Altererythrobacter sp. Z27]|uniref:hypothetical protein n=1 Tax=Altererythrobacter sp. Z27 TaxID=3461147 RepID=UPI004044DE8C
MNLPDRLASLARLQLLRERRERVSTEHARSALILSEEAHRHAMNSEDEIHEALMTLCGVPAMCLDRWSVVAAQLKLAADCTGQASAQMTVAADLYAEAKDRLKGEIVRSQELGDRARKAILKFEAKKDEAKLRDVRSLRNALGERNCA